MDETHDFVFIRDGQKRGTQVTSLPISNPERDVLYYVEFGDQQTVAYLTKSGWVYLAPEFDTRFGNFAPFSKMVKGPRTHAIKRMKIILDKENPRYSPPYPKAHDMVLFHAEDDGMTYVVPTRVYNKTLGK